MTPDLNIMECTLRDGSYAINFQFTAEDTRAIVQALDFLGFDYIEVGHGMGLGASEKGKSVAAETDEIYMQATAESITQSKWGMFCIPGIAELHHIDMAADYGMDFVRVGTNIEDYKLAQPFIEAAKRKNITVCANFMKSYVSPPEKFAEYAAQASDYGADIVYVVDSAGGMLPNDVERYVNAIKSRTPSIKLGFHGHNNLGLATVNGLKAAELGVAVIDTSLQGLGRSSGNIPTEQFLCVLLRATGQLDIDPVAVMDVADKYIRPLIHQKGLDSIDLTSGLALFHSSYMPVIQEYSIKYRVDPRKLILAVCLYNQADAPPELVEREALKLSDMGERGNWKPFFKQYYGGEQCRD